MELRTKRPTIISKETESDKEARLISKVLDRYFTASSFWNQYYYGPSRVLLRDYRMELKLVRDEKTGEIKYPHRSKVFPPIAFEECEIIAPQVIDSILSKRPFFDVTRRRGHPNIGDARKSKILLEYQLDQRDFASVMANCLNEVVLLGNKVGRLRWVYEAEYFTKRQTIRHLGVPIGVREEQILEETYEGPEFVPIPFYCFHIDPATPPGQLQRAEYLHEERVLPLWEFRSEAEQYKYKNVKEAERYVQRGQMLKPTYDEASKGVDSHAENLHMLMYYDHEQVIYLITNEGHPSNGVIIKQEDLYEKHPDGKFPYFVMQSRTNVDSGSDVDLDDPNPLSAPSGFYCFGELKVCHGMQQAITTTLNQRIDQISLSLNPPFFLTTGALENESDLEYGYEPGRIYRLLESAGLTPNDILKQVEIRDFLGGSWNNQMQLLIDMVHRGAGGQDTVAGRVDARNQTATGIMQLTANAMKRFSRKVGNIVEGGLKPILEAMCDMNARYIDPDTIAYAVGNDEPVFVNPEDIVRGASIVIHLSPFYAKEIVQERLLKTAPILAQLNPFIDLTQLTRMILEYDPHIDNVDKILPENTPPVTPFMMKTMFGLLQAQLQISGGQSPGINIKQPQNKNYTPESDAEQNVNILQGLMAGNQGV